MLMAAYSAFQGWHPMQYAYWATTETAPAMINSFEGMFDPAQTNLLPAAALLFARGDVRESTDAYYDPISRAAATDPLTRDSTVHPAAALALRYGVAFDDLPAASGASGAAAVRERGPAASGRPPASSRGTRPTAWSPSTPRAPRA